MKIFFKGISSNFAGLLFKSDPGDAIIDDFPPCKGYNLSEYKKKAEFIEEMVDDFDLTKLYGSNFCG